LSYNIQTKGRDYLLKNYPSLKKIKLSGWIALVKLSNFTLFGFNICRSVNQNYINANFLDSLPGYDNIVRPGAEPTPKSALAREYKSFNPSQFQVDVYVL